MNRDLLRSLTAEAIGTFALVFAGCGAIMVDAKTHQLSHVGVAITFGLVIMFGIYAVGHISGAHFNAAVTSAFALTRHFPWPRALAYWGAQFVGAVCAAALLRGSLGNIAHVGATLPSGSQGQAFLWELVMSAFLMFVILAVATDTRAVGEAAAIAIGGTIGLDAMFGGPITGTSMNPIRSLAPALVCAPVGGAVVGEDPFDADPVPGKEGDRSPQKADCADGLLVAEGLDVGESAVVVDGDVDELPADHAAPFPCSVGAAATVGAPPSPADPFAGAALAAAELLDVDMHELARS